MRGDRLTMNWLVITVLVCAALIGGGLVLRSMLTGNPIIPSFGQRPERRLEVVEQASIDGRRRLILLRRDNVEHLIMTGGPVDLVVETGIGATASTRPRVLASEANTRTDLRKDPPTFGRSRIHPAGPSSGPSSGLSNSTTTAPTAAAGE